MTTEISELNLTPKRKFVNEESESEDQNSCSSQIQPSNSSKRPRQLFDAAKPTMYSNVDCPICNEPIAQNLIQSHAERCLDKPEPRCSRGGIKKNNNKQKSDDWNSNQHDLSEPEGFNSNVT